MKHFPKIDSQKLLFSDDHGFSEYMKESRTNRARKPASRQRLEWVEKLSSALCFRPDFQEHSLVFVNAKGQHICFEALKGRGFRAISRTAEGDIESPICIIDVISTRQLHPDFIAVCALSGQVIRSTVR